MAIDLGCSKRPSRTCMGSRGYAEKLLFQSQSCNLVSSSLLMLQQQASTCLLTSVRHLRQGILQNRSTDRLDRLSDRLSPFTLSPA